MDRIRISQEEEINIPTQSDDMDTTDDRQTKRLISIFMNYITIKMFFFYKPPYVAVVVQTRQLE